MTAIPEPTSVTRLMGDMPHARTRTPRFDAGVEPSTPEQQAALAAKAAHEALRRAEAERLAVERAEIRAWKATMPRPSFRDDDAWRRIMARHEATGLPMVCVEFLQMVPAVYDPDPCRRIWATGHVALRLPDGRLHDARGMHDDVGEMCGEMHPDLLRRCRQVGVPELEGILRDYAALDFALETSLEPDAEDRDGSRMSFAA